MSWVRSERWTEDLTLDLDPGEMLLLLAYAPRGKLRRKEVERNALFLEHLEWRSVWVSCNVNIGSEGLGVEGCDAEQKLCPAIRVRGETNDDFEGMSRGAFTYDSSDCNPFWSILGIIKEMGQESRYKEPKRSVYSFYS